MQLIRLAVIATTLLFGANACKCVNGGEDVSATQQCCARLGGNFRFGNDCEAGSISEHLSNFKGCCEGFGESSDCDCPTCKRDVNGEPIVEKRVPVAF